MTDDTKSPFDRILQASGFTSWFVPQPLNAVKIMPPPKGAFSAPDFMADYVEHGVWGGPGIGWVDDTYVHYCKAQDRAALEQKLAGLGELNRAKMAAQLARETALDRDAACSTAAALHQIGKGVDWFVKMIPTIGTHTASRAVIGMAHWNARMLAFDRARSQALVVNLVLHACIDVSDERLEIDLPSPGGIFEGRALLAQPEPEKPRQPSYLQHDPTKRTKGRLRSGKKVQPRGGRRR